MDSKVTKLQMSFKFFQLLIFPTYSYVYTVGNFRKNIEIVLAIGLHMQSKSLLKIFTNKKIS